MSEDEILLEIIKVLENNENKFQASGRAFKVIMKMFKDLDERITKLENSRV
jgi:hypothetical protein